MEKPAKSKTTKRGSTVKKAVRPTVAPKKTAKAKTAAKTGVKPGKISKSKKTVKAPLVPKKETNAKAPFTVNGHRIKWSIKWKGWEVYQGKKLLQLHRFKKDAIAFANEGLFTSNA
ncbi:MAG TPA: hypothetical protein VF691_11125 [Cytophagaceae bacterium]|jgi:cell envelope opacity-associated protein A